jgi:hypothetical protein
VVSFLGLLEIGSDLFAALLVTQRV